MVLLLVLLRHLLLLSLAGLLDLVLHLDLELLVVLLKTKVPLDAAEVQVVDRHQDLAQVQVLLGGQLIGGVYL